MATPKTPSKPRTKKTSPEIDTTLPAVDAAAEPAKKPARKRSAKAVEAQPVEAVAAPAADPQALRREIARRALELYRAGSKDTFGNWLAAEREVLAGQANL